MGFHYHHSVIQGIVLGQHAARWNFFQASATFQAGAILTSQFVVRARFKMNCAVSVFSGLNSRAVYLR